MRRRGGDRRRGRRTNDATSEGVGEAGRRESQPNRGGATRRVRVEAGASPGSAEASEEGARGTGSTRWVMAYKVEVVWPMVHQSMRANMRRAVRLHATSRSIGAPPYVAEEQRPREGWWRHPSDGEEVLGIRTGRLYIAGKGGGPDRMECAEDGAGAQSGGSTDAGGRGPEQQNAAAGPSGGVEASRARAQRRRLKKQEKRDSARAAMAARGAAALLGPS